MGRLSGEFREPNRKDKVTRFRSETYVRLLGLLVNTLGSHLKANRMMPRRVYGLRKQHRFWTDFDLFSDENSSFPIARFDPSLFGKDFRRFWWIF